MTHLPQGIAHVSFGGGGLFVPARNRYDRQTLAEHVAARVRAKGEVQVLLNNERWLVCLLRGRLNGGCSGCSHVLEVACYAGVDPETAYCVKCAFAGGSKSDPPRHVRQQQAL
jgi:hypothetical protein